MSETAQADETLDANHLRYVGRGDGVEKTSISLSMPKDLKRRIIEVAPTIPENMTVFINTAIVERLERLSGDAKDAS